jgi:hypothetical protein
MVRTGERTITAMNRLSLTETMDLTYTPARQFYLCTATKKKKRRIKKVKKNIREKLERNPSIGCHLAAVGSINLQ